MKGLRKTVMTASVILMTLPVHADGGLFTSTQVKLRVGGEYTVVPNVFKGAFGFLLLILGAVAGALVLLKFAEEVLHTVVIEDDDPSAFRKMFLRLFFTIVIVLLGMTGSMMLMSGLDFA